MRGRPRLVCGRVDVVDVDGIGRVLCHVASGLIVMKAKDRYAFLVSVAFLIFCLIWSWARQHQRLAASSRRARASASSSSLPSATATPSEYQRWKRSLPKLSSYADPDLPDDAQAPITATSPCRMETCFNFSRCLHRPYRHYVYPDWGGSGAAEVDDAADEEASLAGYISDTYRKILSVLRQSPMRTEDPNEACLFVLSIDTLDMDRLSDNFFAKNIETRLKNLMLWNDGQNHVIFNLYSGTYPDYKEDLGFQTGKAILAKASTSVKQYRADFDVSIPLFHATHPERGGEDGMLTSNALPVAKPYFLAFKGKRYVYGIGSETRNALFHLHNGEDVVLLTTCKHGKSWKGLKDERCDEDNESYDRWDYNILLRNSTFCLVPRGRRLGSFRFIETLQSGCVPVVLANEWKLPFSEIIDWSEAAVTLDERLLMQVPEILRTIPEARVHALKQQTQVLWNRYFRSIEEIIDTTLEIIYERIQPHEARALGNWNVPLSDLISASHDLTDGKVLQCSVVINALVGADQRINNVVARQLKALTSSRLVAEFVILWPVGTTPKRAIFHQVAKKLPLTIVELVGNDTSQLTRFDNKHFKVSTPVVLSVNANSVVSSDEIEFMLNVWANFDDRIVGIVPRIHYWDGNDRLWRFSSKWSNEYSMIMLDGAVYSKHFNDLLFKMVSPSTLAVTEQSPSCADILMNFLVSRVTSKPPIKVSQRRNTGEIVARRETHADLEAFNSKTDCLNALISAFGDLPLRKSPLRMDPVLFRDQVANTRKKYKQLELSLPPKRL